MSETVLQPLKVSDVEQMITQADLNIQEANAVSRQVNLPTTGMIMDGTTMSEEAEKKNENMQAALENDRIAQLKAMMAARKQKVREYPKIGRNDACYCGSGKKYKNCCLSTGTYEKLIDAK
jgi:uncharacterized protein YecA (UPF0149 family)